MRIMFNGMFQQVLFLTFTFVNGYRIWIYFIDFITCMKTSFYTPVEVGISFIFSHFETL